MVSSISTIFIAILIVDTNMTIIWTPSVLYAFTEERNTITLVDLFMYVSS